jgi:uncharacterized protein (DUF1697 family)
MPRFVALLRAVNVGGANRISMAELRAVVGAVGFSDVSTYIQSGNVLFEAKEKAEAKVKEPLEQALARRLKNDITVLLRTPAQLRATVKGAPFAGGSAQAKAYVTFLDQPTRRAVPSGTPNGDLEVVGHTAREIFSVAREVRGRSGNPNAFLEKALGVRATTRNWNVVQALAELAS